jgi:hypothetical protein
VGAVAGLRLTAPAPGHGLALVGGLVDRAKGSMTPERVHVASSAWCGTDASATDRQPDAAAGSQIHVIYAFPSDGPDRFAALAPGIASDIGSIDAWWRRQDPTRAPRWDLYAFPGCAPGLDQLDVTRVQLTQPTSFYMDEDTRPARLISELGASFADPYKKYVVFYDGAVLDPRLCGQSLMSPDEGGRYAYSLIYAQACRADIGSGAITASVAAHELGHNLGAVPPGAPNACPGDSAHACDDENDLMYPYTKGQGLNAVTLDVGRNDYYGHPGSWFDVRNSPWLIHLDQPQEPLTVSVTGGGTSAVTSDVPGISCPTRCTASFDQGTTVTLTAVAGVNTRFAGWSGACTADPCVVTLNSAQTVAARFVTPVQVTAGVVKRAGSGGGTSRSRPAGISCPGKCSAIFDSGTRVQLVATPAKNSVLDGWSGACSGKGACTFTATEGATVNATFGVPQSFVPPKACKPTKTRRCRR